MLSTQRRRCFGYLAAGVLSLSLLAGKPWEVFSVLGKGQASHRRLSTAALPSDLPQWSPEQLTDVENCRWISNSVLCVELKNADLETELADLCLSLEKEAQGRSMSNIGGFQSENVRISSHLALCRLVSLLRPPLCRFLFKTRRGVAPKTLENSSDLRVGCQVEHLWVNVNRPGHYNQLHEHGPPLLSRAASVIYYPGDQNDETGGYEPPAAKVRFYEAGRAVEITPEPGLLVIFPTNLLHEVDPVWFGSSPRLSIALNVFVRWLDQPLLQAAFLGDLSALQRDLVAGAVDCCDAELKFQALHLAAEAGHLELVELLLHHGADPKALTLEGWCPLALAAAQGHLEVVKLLKPPGEFVQKDDLLKSIDLRRGFSGVEGAALVASERGHADIVEFLTSG